MLEYRECPIDNALLLSSLYTFASKTFARDYRFTGEQHDFYEVVCVTAGKVGITAEKDVYILSAGQMIIHPPEEFHAIWSDCGTEPETIIFSFRAERFPELMRRVFTLSAECIGELKDIYRYAERTFVLKNNNVECVKPQRELAASALLKRLELLLIQAISSDFGNDAKCSDRSAENYALILSAMEKNLGEKKTSEEIARECNVSVPTLERTVRRYAHCGAMAYYNQLKLKKADQLLLEGKSVKEVSLTLGFSNQNYFSACYKKWTGSAPSSRKKLPRPLLD